MEKDFLSHKYLSDNERYADLINVFLFHGKQLVLPENLMEMDSKTGFWQPSFLHLKKSRKNFKYRDLIRKVALGINFAIIGIENQSFVNYLMPARTMGYDAGEYERQASVIKKQVRRQKGICHSEFIAGFTKENKLSPCITLVVYWGEEEWTHGKELYDILDFTDIPDDFRFLVNNYHINLIEVKKLTDTSMFQTDLKQVFDFIRYSDDKTRLIEMVESDSTYHELADDAFDVISAFTNTVELTNKQKFHVKENKYDMCKAIKELIEDGRMEGYNNMKINLIYKKIQKGKTLDRIADEMECEIDEIRPLYDLVKAAGKNCDLEEICKRVSAGI